MASRRRRSDFRDLTGKVFGRWTVIGYSHSKGRVCYYRCLCVCGVSRTVGANSLRASDSASCGCLHRETVSARRLTHGHARHGRQHPLYSVWAQMLHRCDNPAAKGYPSYGGRGVRVCSRWRRSFQNFLADMGERPSSKHTLDRFPDNDGDYKPGNCRWATVAEQNRNKRTNRLLTHDDKTMCLSEWAEASGVPISTLAMRLKLGWSVSDAITKPVHPKRKKHLVTYNGETLRIDTWARRMGINVAVLVYRLGRGGWSVVDALTRPVDTSKRPREHR